MSKVIEAIVGPPGSVRKSADTEVKQGKVKKKTGRARKAGHAETVAARRLRSIQLRRAGASYEQISRATGVSIQQAFRDVRAAREATIQLVNEEAAALIATELDRLDGFLVALTPGIKAGQVGAIKEARRIGESRRKLLGLDNARPQEIIISPAPVDRQLAHVSDADLLVQIEKAVEVLRANNAVIDLFPEPDLPGPPSPEEQYAAKLALRAAAGGRTLIG